MKSRQKFSARQAKAVIRSGGLLTEALERALAEIEGLKYRSTLAYGELLDMSVNEKTSALSWGIVDGISGMVSPSS